MSYFRTLLRTHYFNILEKHIQKTEGGAGNLKTPDDIRVTFNSLLSFLSQKAETQTLETRRALIFAFNEEQKMKMENQDIH